VEAERVGRVEMEGWPSVHGSLPSREQVKCFNCWRPLAQWLLAALLAGGAWPGLVLDYISCAFFWPCASHCLLVHVNICLDVWFNYYRSFYWLRGKLEVCNCSSTAIFGRELVAQQATLTCAHKRNQKCYTSPLPSPLPSFHLLTNSMTAPELHMLFASFHLLH
jgi:hypothetical protein